MRAKASYFCKNGRLKSCYPHKGTVMISDVSQRFFFYAKKQEKSKLSELRGGVVYDL